MGKKKNKKVRKPNPWKKPKVTLLSEEVSDEGYKIDQSGLGIGK